MPPATAVRTSDLVERVRALFLPPQRAVTGPGRVGVEVELLPVRHIGHMLRPVSLPEVEACLRSDPALRRDGRITFEPGGQLELSPQPATTVAGCLDALTTLLARVRRCGTDAGITFVSAAVSPWHDTDEIGLQNDGPRYSTMQAHFDRIGPAGRAMMRQTAALQVCVDLDAVSNGDHLRWHALNQAAPVLTAMFAASPVAAGRATGLRSTRIAIWQSVDTTRTGFGAEHTAGEPVPDYAAFALGATPIPLPRNGDRLVPTPPTMREWIRVANGRPDADDIDHHLSTLFPPVRPRGYIETRFCDALPARWLPVAVCLIAALCVDERSCREVIERIPATARPGVDAWRRCAREGPADAELRGAGLELVDVALTALRRLPAGWLPDNATALIHDFRERFTKAGRCPADELLDAYRSDPEDPAPWI